MSNRPCRQVVLHQLRLICNTAIDLHFLKRTYSNLVVTIFFEIINCGLLGIIPLKFWHIEFWYINRLFQSETFSINPLLHDFEV